MKELEIKKFLYKIVLTDSQNLSTNSVNYAKLLSGKNKEIVKRTKVFQRLSKSKVEHLEKYDERYKPSRKWNITV